MQLLAVSWLVDCFEYVYQVVGEIIKPLTLRGIITNTTMCYYNTRKLGLLQITTTCYYNLRQLILKFTTGITIHERTHARQVLAKTADCNLSCCSVRSFTNEKFVISLISIFDFVLRISLRLNELGALIQTV